MTPSRIVVIGTDYPELERACPHWNGIKTGLERLEIPYRFVSCRPTLDIGAVVTFKPDLVVYALKDMITHPQWRRELRERLPDAKLVIWYGDYRDDRTGQTDADCSEVDAMFISNDAQEQYYKWKWRVPRVHYLPLGSEPIKAPHKSKLYAFPFVFIGGQFTGGAFHSRAREIERFRLEAGLTLVNSFDAPMRARIFKAMPEIYSSSTIALDISHFTDAQGYTSIRFFEIPAFWGFALTKRFPGCEELYPPDTRAYFDTFEEAIELKEYYTAHPVDREAMLKRAHALSYEHTYDRRFKTMFSLL